MQSWIETIKLHSAVHATAIGQPRHGIITSVDAVNHAVKVMIEPDGVESGWIPDGAIAAGGLKISCPSEVGSQVLVVAVEGDAEHPVVIARLFDTVATVPVSPATSQPVQAGEIGIFLSGGVYMQMTRDGIYFGGNMTIAGSVRATGDILSGDVSLQQHIHSQVQSGDGVSGPPRS